MQMPSKDLIKVWLDSWCPNISLVCVLQSQPATPSLLHYLPTWSHPWTLQTPQNSCVLSRFSHVWLFMTLQMVACQAPLSMGSSRQEYESGLPCPPPGDLPDPGIKPASLMSPTLAGRFFTTRTTQEAPQTFKDHTLHQTLSDLNWFCLYSALNYFICQHIVVTQWKLMN